MKSVLIVDDSSFIRNLLRSILADRGYHVVAEAVNGFEAIQCYKKFRPDLVIMDIIMPVMDGLSATEAIVAIDANAKIIACSVCGQQTIIIKLLRAGVKDFIVKPFREDQIMYAIEKQFQLN